MLERGLQFILDGRTDVRCGEGANNSRLPGPVTDFGALLSPLTRVDSRVLSLIG